MGIGGPLEFATEEEIREQMDTNFMGLVHCVDAVLPHMRNKGSGKIIAISSIGGLMGQRGHLFPSLYDANSLVQIEAACQSTPALFLEGAKTAATVTPGVNGYVSPAREENYARAIIDILADAEGYGRVANAAFRDLYISWDDVISDVYNDYCLFDLSKKNQY